MGEGEIFSLPFLILPRNLASEVEQTGTSGRNNPELLTCDRLAGAGEALASNTRREVPVATLTVRSMD